MMIKMSNKFKYGAPVRSEEFPQPRERLPQYDECLEEFLVSGQPRWKVNIKALPSKKPGVILSSLKWRTKNIEQFKNIKVFMNSNQIFLERIPQTNE